MESSVSVQFEVIHHFPAIANPANCVAIRFCCDVVKTDVMMLSWKSRKRVITLSAFANMYQRVPMTSNDQSKHHTPSHCNTSKAVHISTAPAFYSRGYLRIVRKWQGKYIACIPAFRPCKGSQRPEPTWKDHIVRTTSHNQKRPPSATRWHVLPHA